MKKLFLLTLFVIGLVAVNANAQIKVVKKEYKTDAVTEMAAKAAAADENIVEKVCQKSGTVSYYHKSTCEKSGTTKMTKVIFDAESGAFVSADTKKGAKKSCAGDKKGKKGCCAGAKKGKGCSSKDPGRKSCNHR